MKALLLFCPLLFGVTGCTQDALCSNDVQQVARDPGSDRYAATLVRNCGATTDYATVVRVGRASEAQSAVKEVFVADTDHGAATRGAQGAIWTSVVWTAPGKLSIAYAKDARVYRQKDHAKGATISFLKSGPMAAPQVD
ncbi:hypothetical protein KY084_12625 [Stakelama sp. CBK3Z-3]|uniref:Lipoprotein n=1 Tax=Stakelama flava TaxID=2860338 RepID=A0ABS6XNB7_9SPHN|nr:hypothetical protein [Stakelama flava]MBW4331715.1 hypothetical protein [Stakelama flava]